MAQGFGSNATYQFCRTERWLARLEAVYDGRYKPIGSFDDPLDSVPAFFLNCYHVKDWLKNKPQWHDDVDSGVKRSAVEQFVKESEALKICGDICNGNKHSDFDCAPLSGGPLDLLSVRTRVDSTVGAAITTTRYTLRTARGETDVYALAKECLDSWRNFIFRSTPDSLQALASRNPRHRSKHRPAKTTR